MQSRSLDSILIVSNLSQVSDLESIAARENKTTSNPEWRIVTTNPIYLSVQLSFKKTLIIHFAEYMTKLVCLLKIIQMQQVIPMCEKNKILTLGHLSRFVPFTQIPCQTRVCDMNFDKAVQFLEKSDNLVLRQKSRGTIIFFAHETLSSRYTAITLL